MPTRFTIALPAHDRRETVVLAVSSALEQTRPADRIVVLCDGCTDGTAEAVRALGVEALELEKGPGYGYAHRNLVLGDDADVVLWLADDDLLLPDHLEQLGRTWDTDRDGRVMACAPAVIVHEDDALTWLARDWSHPEVRALLATRENHLPMASISVDAKAAREAGGWRADRPREADRDLWIRILADGGRVDLAAEPTVLHFRASTREQAWPARVRQNEAWLARLRDPAELERVRRELRAARARRDGAEYAERARLLDEAEWAQERFAAMTAEIAELRGTVPELQRHLRGWEAEAARVTAELEAAGARERAAAERAQAAAERERDLVAHLAARDDDLVATTAALAAVTADRDAARRTLAAIYAGRWWKLRDLVRR